jgi:cyclohexyl-isocyanide hydratase
MNNKISRRSLALYAAGCFDVLNAAEPSRPPGKEMEMHGLKYFVPDRPERIAMLVYPGMTALDLIGPQQVLGYLMGTQIHLVWKTKDPVLTDTGVSLLPTQTLAECSGPLEMLFVPGGGRGTVQLMDDEEILGFLSKAGERAGLVTSVCSGALVLGAAGLLKGHKATTHWAVRDVLPLLGATPVKARVVEDRNRITAAGITAGIDFGLRIAARWRGDDYARILELSLEYDPHPPFHTGTPESAGDRIVAAMSSMYHPLNDDAQTAAKRHVRL